ncbi:MAG TPA: chemotaxis protein CheB [Lysobacter sp.]|nr:chemotaxis protein CheB [Lysobacter sp.]
MSNSARRVVLLARPGAARDRMREALGEAGANVVLEADPTATDQAAVLEASPEVALVVLDAATDEALDRFDDLLANPQIEVFFEEAEHAVGRVGWDAARWVRHLSAKLHHSDNVLPPGRSAETVAIEIPTASVASIAVPPPLPEVPEIAPVDVHSDMELLSFELGDEAAHYTSEHSADPAPPLAAKLELELVEDVSGDSVPAEIRIEGLELEEDHPVDAHRFQNDLNDLHSRIASMELVVDESPARVRGAVLVLAGIGGPDAVRQLLGALPEAFPRAVLVQQRLDGGHYDKLVAQMQRATALPVRLAVAGDALQAATVYILPPTLGVQESGQGLVFTDSPVDLLVALPAGDSAVLMLSGSDPSQVDAVMKLGAGGALIAGQALDGCYDVAAPAALVSRGGQAGKPQELARRLAERWH